MDYKHEACDPIEADEVVTKHKADASYGAMSFRVQPNVIFKKKNNDDGTFTLTRNHGGISLTWIVTESALNHFFIGRKEKGYTIKYPEKGCPYRVYDGGINQ